MIRAYHKNDLPKMISVWNEIVREGDTFPQEELLDTKSGAAFFAAQDFTGIYLDEQGNLCGLYISCIRAMSDAAVIYAAPALRFLRIRTKHRSARLLSSTAS